jgi:hypothetical protein
MDLSPAKYEILEALLLHYKPVKAVQLAKELGKEFPAVQMHLIGLVKIGHAESPQKGQYFISANGKKALGLPETTKEKAQKILAKATSNEAFHFYAGIGKPLNVYAHDLLEFCDKVSQVRAESVEFHLNRGDFEVWFKALGDVELAKKIALLNGRKMKAEELQEKIREITANHYACLSRVAGPC